MFKPGDIVTWEKFTAVACPYYLVVKDLAPAYLVISLSQSFPHQSYSRLDKRHVETFYVLVTDIFREQYEI